MTEEEQKKDEAVEETVEEEKKETTEAGASKDVEDLDLEDVEVISIDLSEFQGKPLKIEKITKLMVKSAYDENGNYTPNQTRDVMVLKVETESFTEIETKDGKKAVTASRMFNLKQNEETKKWGVSTSENSKLRAFMNKMKVAKVKDLVGMAVVPVIGKKGYMEFAL